MGVWYQNRLLGEARETRLEGVRARSVRELVGTKPIAPPKRERGVRAEFIAWALMIAAGAVVVVLQVPIGQRAEAQAPAYRVIDGDTIADAVTGERFRLANIDTAETGERAQCDAERAHGERAKAAMRQIIAHAAHVRAERIGQTDRYGRTLARIRADGRDVGRTLMDHGLARPWTGRRQSWCAANGDLLL